MSGPAVAHAYRYPHASSLGDGALRLAVSGPEPGARFFSGAVAHPRVTAILLRGLSRVVAARYHVPARMLERILALADPVVTSGGGLLRFEGFSSCASAYARVDLLPGAFAAIEDASPGTTNVDFNGEMLAALAGVRDADGLALSVGSSEVVVASARKSVVERRVPLPVRWLKGFVEVQAHQASMKPALEMKGAEAARFFRALPRARTSRHASWVVPSGSSFRLSQRQARGGVAVTGTERLRPLEELSAHSKRLRVYAPGRPGASAWELDLGFARFVLVVSAEVWRGFSGEGQALAKLTTKDEKLITRVRAALRWRQDVRASSLARELDAGEEDVARALAALGARGLVGYDLALASYFHRELPFDLSRVEALQPRLADARKLVASGGVSILGEKDGALEASVRGSGVTHRVRIIDDDVARCTCPELARAGLDSLNVESLNVEAIRCRACSRAS